MHTSLSKLSCSQLEAIKRIAKKVSDLDEEFDDIYSNIAADSGLAKKEEDEQKAMQEAREGVSELSLTPKEDCQAYHGKKCGAILQIKGRRKIPLSPGEAALMEALIADSGPSDDSLVCWKRDEDVTAHLKKRCGANFTKQLVNLLRDKLFKYRENRWLVMREEGKIRFALRRTASVTATGHK